MENSSVAGFILSTSGILLGWFLNQLSGAFSSRKDSKRQLKKVLFNLLEVLYIFSKSTINPDVMEKAKSLVLFKVPNDTRAEVKSYLDEYLNLPSLSKEMTPDIVSSLKELRNDYEQSITSLSEIDPIQAYYLRGRTNILESFDEIEDIVKRSITSSSPNNTSEVNNHVSDVVEQLKRNLIKETLQEVKGDIRKISWKVGLRSYFKSKKIITQLEKSDFNRIRTQLENATQQIIAGLEAQKNPSN